MAAAGRIRISICSWSAANPHAVADRDRDLDRERQRANQVRSRRLRHEAVPKRAERSVLIDQAVAKSLKRSSQARQPVDPAAQQGDGVGDTSFRERDDVCHACRLAGWTSEPDHHSRQFDGSYMRYSHGALRMRRE
ncbi:MAG: hypothetical protein WDO24_28225 [Pseudomonadota bacterium]